MRELMWKYRDLPMDLADAALVRVASANESGGSSQSTGETLGFVGLIASAVAKSCRDPPAEGVSCAIIWFRFFPATWRSLPPLWTNYVGYRNRTG